MLKSLLILSYFIFANVGYCQIYSFEAGEELTYKISYGLNIGEIKLDVKKKNYII